MFKAFLKVHSSACSIHVQYCSCILYTIGCVVQVQLRFNEHHVCVHIPTLLAWSILAPASNSVFTTSRCPFSLAPFNELQPFCNTNVIITRGWTSGGGCWNITYDRCNISVQREVKGGGKEDRWVGGKGHRQGKENRLYTKRYRRWAQKSIELLPTTDRASRVLWSMRYCTSNLQFSLSFNTFSWHRFFGYELNTWYSHDWGEFLQINFSSNTFCCIISNFIATLLSI